MQVTVMNYTPPVIRAIRGFRFGLEPNSLDIRSV